MHLPVVKRDLKANFDALFTAFLEAAIQQGVLWGVAMSFALGLPKEVVLWPAAFFGLVMGAVFAPQLMTVTVSTAIGSHEAAAVREWVRRLLLSDGYGIGETSDGYTRYDTRSGLKDLSIGPVNLVPSGGSITTSCDSDTLLLSGPFSAVKKLAEQLNQPPASTASPPPSLRPPIRPGPVPIDTSVR